MHVSVHHQFILLTLILLREICHLLAHILDVNPTKFDVYKQILVAAPVISVVQYTSLQLL